jgi:ABC-type bacteriocin/lantibiotic exporter with double-glycine peptidase domain
MTIKPDIKLISKTFIKQHSQFYCGLACLASITKYYGGETTQEKLREISGTTLSGTSLLGLYQAAQKTGFEAGGYEADIKNLKEQNEPVILNIIKDEKLEHRALITYVRSIFLVRQSREMNVRLIHNFFGKLLFLPKPFFDSTSTGDMVARMNDASRIQKVVVFLSSQVVIDVLVVLVSAGYIFVYSVSTGLFSLLSILQRFHKTESGSILVNGESWNTFSTQTWRNYVATVEQHVELFNGTVLENISLTENPNVEEIVAFCQQHGFHDFIMEFQQGYATIINENSTNLSGGQRQLIALARALYSKPKLLLLDEATAAMGRRTERFVLELLNKLKTEVPVIFVTHRPQLARYTDRIYVIEEKTVSATGTHDQLISKNQFYRDAFEELVLY